MKNNIGSKKRIILKLCQVIVALLVLSILVLAISRSCPQDPLVSYYGEGYHQMSQEQKEVARENLGLNDSFFTQYVKWAGRFIHGDLGISLKYKRPVLEIIGKMWINTLLLGGISFALTFFLAIKLGKLCALREKNLLDRWICKIGVISGNIPTFFLAILLILLFGVNLKLLPIGGAYSYGNEGNVLDRVYHLLLPVMVLVVEHLWYYAYMIRNKLLEETRKDYVLLAKSKGLERRYILDKHCMVNIMPSIYTMMAISVPHILSGTYVVEAIFSYPGLGSLTIESALYSDYNMLMALTVFTGAAVIISSLIGQYLSEKSDPRMRELEGTRLNQWEVEE